MTIEEQLDHNRQQLATLEREAAELRRQMADIEVRPEDAMNADEELAVLRHQIAVKEDAARAIRARWDL